MLVSMRGMGSQQHFVLLRGLLREQRHWGDFPKNLQARFPEAIIRTLDIPGNGRLNKQRSPTCISEMTDALRRQLPDQAEINLIALSMGGMIALDWMNRFPLEVKTAVLINSSIRGVSPIVQRLRWQRFPTVFKMVFQSPEQMEQTILRLTSNLHHDDPDVLIRWRQWQRQNPVSKKNAFRQLLAAAKFTIRTRPMHPVLIIGSKKDELVDYRCSLMLHQKWGTDYCQHDTAGHDLSLDDPQWLSQVIEQWIVHDVLD